MEKQKIEAINEIAESVREKMDADVYLYNAPIDAFNYGKLLDCFSIRKNRNENRKNAVLILVTAGGLPDIACNIAKFFQKEYENFAVFVPSWCKSAGTMVILGANYIMMEDYGSELGPLDVQIKDKDNASKGWTTGLGNHNVFSAVRLIQKNAVLDILKYNKYGIQVANMDAIRLAIEATGNFVRPIMEQMRPSDIAEEYRVLRNGIEYSRKIIRKNGIISLETVEKLVYDYHDHSFQIDRDEAIELFSNGFVRYPTNELRNLAHQLGGLVNINNTGTVISFPVEMKGDAHEQANEKQEND